MLFLVNSILVNGTTTFLLRFAKKSLSSDNKKIDILIINEKVDQDVLAEFEQVANIYFLDEFIISKNIIFSKSPFLSLASLDIKRFNLLLENNENTVHVMGLFGLMLSQMLIQKYNVPLKITVGIYHQNEFMFRHKGYYFCNSLKQILEKLPAENYIFFNDANRESYARYLNRSLEGACIVPIGIDDSTVMKLNYNKSTLDICSVGNLDRFKTYNLTMLQVVRNLIDKGYNLTYTIYGDGELKGDIYKQISALNLEGIVVLKGRIPYSKLREVISGYDAFVGSGTAILESAITGVPSIIGIESTYEAITYGYLSDISGFTYNELVEGRDKVSIEECLEFLFCIENRKTVGDRCLTKAKEFLMGNTFRGFKSVQSNCSVMEQLNFSSVKLFFSLFRCVVEKVLSINSDMSHRRNQGDISK